MHIVFLVDAVDNQNAGVFVYVKNLILAVKRRVGHGVDKNTYSFVHLRHNKIFDFGSDGGVLSEKISNYVVPRRRIFGYDSFRRFFLIPWLVKKLGADVVIETCHIGPFGLPKNIKKGVVIHDITPVLFPKWHVWRSVLIHKLLLGKVVKNSDFIIVPSECTKCDICEHYGVLADKIRVVHPSVDIGCKIDEVSESYKKLDFLRKFRFDLDEEYILYLGTIEPRKNLEFLIENYLDIFSEGLISKKLVLTGGRGWKMDSFYKKYSGNKNIVFTGYVNDEMKQVLYKNADLFVYPSMYEGFGIPPLEALSYGIVPVLSKTSSLYEVYKNEAVFFEVDKKESLQIAILSGLLRMQFYAALKQKIGVDFVKTFSWDKLVEGIVSF